MFWLALALPCDAVRHPRHPERRQSRFFVMTGLDPAIHVNPRDKPGDDDGNPT
jgi:hypothetical protein